MSFALRFSGSDPKAGTYFRRQQSITVPMPPENFGDLELSASLEVLNKHGSRRPIAAALLLARPRIQAASRTNRETASRTCG